MAKAYRKRVVMDVLRSLDETLLVGKRNEPEAEVV
jgi:hypothetical protein